MDNNRIFVLTRDYIRLAEILKEELAALQADTAAAAPADLIALTDETS